jgi:hypothetical protein
MKKDKRRSEGIRLLYLEAGGGVDTVSSLGLENTGGKEGDLGIGTRIAGCIRISL